MSAKSVIQKLQDCDLIRLFLEFVQTHQLQYQKTSKQISYKCYQATWILINFKANGYGRTQSQAYKHALRNLLQILIEQPMYTQFFANTLTSIQNFNNRPSIKKQPLTESVPSNNQQPVINTNNPKKIFNSKTEGHQPIQKETNTKKGQNYSKLYESYSKINQNQKSQSKFGTINKGWENSNTNIASVKMIQSTGVYNTVSQVGQNDNDSIKKVNESLVNPVSQGYNNNMTKIDSNKENTVHSNMNMNNNNTGASSQQLRKALKKLAQLQDYLTSINKENEMLKRQLKQVNSCNSNNSDNNNDNETLILVQQKQSISFSGGSGQYVQKVQILENDESMFMKNKPQVPKLKLQILPNYHKKSQKSLNESLMAAYNQKRDQSVKKLVC